VESRTPDEVFVFGSVYVRSTPEKYLKLASDMDELRKLPSYLAIRKFNDPPQLFRPGRLHSGGGRHQATEEVRAGQMRRPSCRPKAMDAFKHSVNWSAPDAANQANQFSTEDGARSNPTIHTGRGTRTLGTYYGQASSGRCGGDVCIFTQPFEGPFPRIYPKLDRYLLEYPQTHQKISNLGFIGRK